MKLIGRRNLMFRVAHLTSKTTKTFSAFHTQLLLDESFKVMSTLFPLLFESITLAATTKPANLFKQRNWNFIGIPSNMSF